MRESFRMQDIAGSGLAVVDFLSCMSCWGAVVPIEDLHDTLALGLSSMEREGGDAVQNGLIGFESYRAPCGEPINVALYGCGDGSFRSVSARRTTCAWHADVLSTHISTSWSCSRCTWGTWPFGCVPGPFAGCWGWRTWTRRPSGCVTSSACRSWSWWHSHEASTRRGPQVRSIGGAPPSALSERRVE